MFVKSHKEFFTLYITNHQLFLNVLVKLFLLRTVKNKNSPKKIQIFKENIFIYSSEIVLPTCIIMDEKGILPHLQWNSTTYTSEVPTTALFDSNTRDHLLGIRNMIWFIAYPILIIFGTFGNLLVFVVMRRGSLKHVSACFYMSILALADTGKPFY